MRLIGITGSIACGKTTVSRELLHRGYPVIDGDSLARELTGPNGQAIQPIRAVFGDRYLLPDGSLNRKEMGLLIFSDPNARQRLDQIMAPFLRSITLSRIESVRSSGAKLCFLDMPLLYEKGYDQYCDTVWCVWLPEDLQLKRLMDRDGYTQSEALSRIRAVLSSDEKANRSSVVIDNSGSVESTIRQVSDLLHTEISRTEVISRRRRSAGTSSVKTSAPVNPDSFHEHDTAFERPDASRKKPSSRKTAWKMPRWILVSLICLSSVLAVSFTAQMLMNAYLAKRHQTQLEEQEAIDRKYPLLYEDIICRTAEDYNLSPALIAAVILNESSFNPSAESSVGARGLMQLMPDTAEWIARKLRLDNYQFDQMDIPETNILFGCWYLNYLSSLFSGNPLCVVCAYHAGQGEISSWLTNPLYSSDGITLIQKNLPEGPTKQYAGRVTRDYGIYKAKYFAADDLVSSSDTVTVSR